MTTRLFAATVVGGSLVLLTACGRSESGGAGAAPSVSSPADTDAAPSISSPADSGAAPTISSLAIDTDAVRIGETRTLSGTFQFQDGAGDVSELYMKIGMPNGKEMLSPPTELATTRGLLTGSIEVELGGVFPLPGQYELTVWVRDEKGNDSNRLTHSFEATE